MIELAFVACLVLGSHECKEEKLLYMEGSLMACMLHGQADLATWAGLNPGWKIERWSCREHDPTVADL